MSQTTKWDLPYPELDDPADVPLWAEALAVRLDSLMMSFLIDVEDNLPSSGQSGLIFIASDSGRIYFDTGTGWILMNSFLGLVTREMLAPDLKPSFTATPALEAIRALGRGNNEAASGNDLRFPTDDQKAALAGTAGAPSDINRYVTTLDSRLPTANQKAALAGTVGTPSDTNRYVTDQDGRLGSRIPVSVIPPNPTLWQEIILIADGPNHILWRLIWDGTAWCFLGGPPKSSFSAGGGTILNTTAYVTVGTQVTVPFAGYYQVRIGASEQFPPDSGGNGAGLVSYSINGAAASDDDAAWLSPDIPSPNTGADASTLRKKAFAAGTTLLPKGRVTAYDTGEQVYIKNVWLEIEPVYLDDV